MEDAGGISTVEHGGMTITSLGTSGADVKASLVESDKADAPAKPEKEAKPDKPKRLSPSDHARELGKRGGQAAAERRAEAREKTPAEAPEAREAKVRETPEPRGENDEREREVEEPDEAEDKDEPLSKRAQRRIEVATRKQAEARRELEAERTARAQERARYEAELAAHRVARGEAPGREGAQPDRRESPAQDGKPREEDFERYSDYLDARDEHNRSVWTREHEGRQQAQRDMEQFKGLTDTFLKHVTPELLDDLDPELLSLPLPYYFNGPNEPVTIDSILSGELAYTGDRAPAVLRHLTEHPEELQRLRALRSHPEIRVEVQLLARTLGSKPDATAGDPPGERERPSKVATSKASPPVRPVTGAPHIADGDGAPREGEDFDAWNRRTGKRASAQR